MNSTLGLYLLPGLLGQITGLVSGLREWWPWAIYVHSNARPPTGPVLRPLGTPLLAVGTAAASERRAGCELGAGTTTR